jgi:hypothetical protein
MGDCVNFSFDTFHDGRNAFQFEVSPLGARVDGQSTNERQFSADWNPVWELAVGRFAGGWTQPFAVTPSAMVQIGWYDFATARVGYTFGQQRPVSGNLLIEQGAFYNEERDTLARGFPDLQSRAFIVKINRLFRV